MPANGTREILLHPAGVVLHPLQSFAARNDASATPAPEGRQIIAQRVSTGKDVKARRAPERGGRTDHECIFRPVPGLANLACGPRAGALGYLLSPSGFREHDSWLRLLCSVGQDGILRAGWQPALGSHLQTPAGGLPTRRRLPTCPTSRYAGPDHEFYR
jgi:hypothetical protein